MPIKPTNFNFQGFYNPTTTPVPDEIFDSMMYHLSGAELKVLLYICRRTFGFKKTSDNISISQMLHGIIKKSGEQLDLGVGMSKPTLLRALKSLSDNGVIIAEQRRSAEKGNEATNYRLRMLEHPLGKKMSQGGYQNFTKPLVKELNPPLVKESYPQQTVLQQTGEQIVIVVEALTNFGVSKRVAQKLTDSYPEEYLLQKLDLVQWMVTTGSSLVGKNPAGYLRRAIEEDYLPPPQYQTPDQRQKDEETLEAARQRRQEAEEEHRRTQELLQQRLREEHPPQRVGEDGLNTESAWSLTLEQLKEQTSRSTVEIWLRNTMLLEVTGNTAQVMVPSQFALDWIERRLYQPIVRTLGAVLQQDVEVEFVAPQSPE